MFEEVVKTKQLSIAVVGDTLDGIRRMFDGAAFKRPKAFVIKGDHTRAVENKVRFVLPEILVRKCLDSATNVKIRENLISDTSLSSSDIVISILNVGTFSLVDIERMKTWYEVSKKIIKARKLMQFVERAPIEDDHENEGRQQILRTTPFMNVDSVFRATHHDISFMDLAGYGGEQWLNDSCVYVASLRVAREATKLTWRQPTHITVVDPVYMQMTDIDRRKGFLDTKDYVFTKVHTNRIVCCPTYIKVDFPHWCGIIFDMERRIVWKYDPFRKKSFLDEVERIITSVYMEIMNPELKMDIRTFPGWLQRDGYSCGVLMVQWFELYLSVARTTPPDASIPVAHGAKMSPKQLTYERYKHFSYVFDSTVTNVDIEQ